MKQDVPSLCVLRLVQMPNQSLDAYTVKPLDALDNMNSAVCVLSGEVVLFPEV